MKYDCLIVDDEIALSQSTCEYFNMFNVKTFWAKDAETCLAFFGENEADLILLDINLGNDSGFELCKQLRNTVSMPILFISARTSDDDVIMALNIGGDDYIQKPYSLGVLLAKVKAVLKRHHADEKNQYTFGRCMIDFDLERLYVDGQDTKLKAMEYSLLAFLVKNKNKIVTKGSLFQKVWGGGIIGDGTLNVHIRRLREKIEIDPNEPQFIKTIWGTGYVFEGE